MRKVVQFMHISLDGFVGGPNGEMDWINVNEELFRFASDRTKASDTALYGRKTFEMMDAYWPTAADQPNASWHDIDHGNWYNNVEKVVISRTINSDPSKKMKVIGQDLVKEINDLKNGPGRDIIIFGSPGAGHSLAQQGLVDEYWFFVNPILIGKGIPMFNGQKEITKMKLVETHTFKSGIVCLNHRRI